MQEYLDWSHEMKDMLFEFQVSKRTQAMVDKQRKEKRDQPAQSNTRVALSNRRQGLTGDWNEGNNLRMNMIHMASHLNFGTIDLVSHFAHQIHQFGNISMDSTEF